MGPRAWSGRGGARGMAHAARGGWPSSSISRHSTDGGGDGGGNDVEGHR